MTNLQELISKIEDLDQEKMRLVQERLNNLTKPQGSLGVLEELALKLAGITGEVFPQIKGKAVVVMAADHGVVAEGVSAFPQEVTPQMVINFLNGGAAINVLSRHAGAEVVCVDIGVAADVTQPGLINKKIRYGTANIAQGPAMTGEEAVKAIMVGVDLVAELKGKGINLIATGEMGIGNTTPSTAILVALTGQEIRSVLGRGTGIDETGVRKKEMAIAQALEVNRPDPSNPLDVLVKVGGLEIAGLTGVILGAAVHHLPVVIDGFISTAAALIAGKLAPKSTAYMIPSHVSLEPGHKLMLKELGLKPMLDMDMRLGEGTGAVLAFPIIEASTKILAEMATFAEAGVSNKS